MAELISPNSLGMIDEWWQKRPKTTIDHVQEWICFKFLGSCLESMLKKRTWFVWWIARLFALSLSIIGGKQKGAWKFGKFVQVSICAPIEKEWWAREDGQFLCPRVTILGSKQGQEDVGALLSVCHQWLAASWTYQLSHAESAWWASLDNHHDGITTNFVKVKTDDHP